MSAHNARLAPLCLAALIIPAFSSVLRFHNETDLHHRDARDVKTDCITPLFEKMQSCCPVPLFIPPEPQRSCTNGAAGIKPGIFHNIREKVLQPLRNSRMLDDTDFETQAQQFIGGPMCFIECIFKEMKLMKDETQIDLSVIETKFLNNIKNKKVYAPWVPIVVKVLSESAAEMENVPISTISAPQGKTCSTAPGYFMQHLRRALILQCPETSFGLSPGCVEARRDLVKCNPLDVLKSVTKATESTTTKMVETEESQ